MFLSCRRSYTRDGSQRAEGVFLAIFSDDQHNLWGIAQHVRLTQCGHWMMGRLRVGNQGMFSISGTYGHDGLPLDIAEVSEGNRKFLKPVPPALKEIFWKGGGHNSAGAEAQDMYNWGMSILSPQQRANMARRGR